ncbi:haloacid dehalogenase-like hydrolase/Sucrose-6F-phosphate phosphohydrolase, putative [Angomonas deanei]|uniref:Haloacid dehalogenase-like hydrolase/Sucrose-6F-phosphate phosphohydrolase, putative n=1 Tax=Angomonas deanei TaxID=59799 RepID=A0A7G2CIL5_9TRYP|nr:haloacid dehalogenase-like hydrolase/Sucrose-6F-phosphate phosphohydrolase, putative [Angomonas deanei]
MSKSYRLIASDMDGTLLNDAHRMSEKTKKVLCDLMYKHGVHFLFATGRHCLAVEDTRTEFIAYIQDYLKEENLESSPLAKETLFYLVSFNGGRVHTPNGKLIIEHNIDNDIVTDIYRRYCVPNTAKRADSKPGDKEVVYTSAYTTDVWFMTANYYPGNELEQKFGARPFFVPYPKDGQSPEEVTKDLNAQEKELYKHKNNLGTQSVFDWFPTEKVGKLCLRCDSIDLLHKFERELNEKYGDRVSVAFSSNHCLDVTQGGISKANAIQEVIDVIQSGAPAGHAPIKLSEVVSFGDSMNDKEMLAVAGMGYLMANAQPRLKEELKDNATCQVTKLTNDEDGVATILSELFSL